MTRVEIPLLHDNHTHTSLYAAFRSCADISGLDAAQAAVFLAGLPTDRLSVVRGWKSNEFVPDARLLAALPPVLLVNWSLHGFLLSDAALPFVEQAVPDVAAHRDDAAWREANVPRLFDAYCGLAGLDEAKLAGFMDSLLPLGIGSACDLVAPSPEAFRALLRSPRTDGAFVGPETFARLGVAERRRCLGVKLFLDGAIGARTAAVDSAWIGGGEALYTYDDATLEARFARAASDGAALAVHAIGEGAIAQALRILGRCWANGLAPPGFRLEHAQFVTRDQARLARDLGVVLSMQPNFTSDTVDYADRLPASTLARNNPFRMLVDEVGFEPGKDLVFGSDGMPHGIAYAATWSLFPPVPSQRLSLEELVAGYGTARGITGTTMLEIDEGRRMVRVMEKE